MTSIRALSLDLDDTLWEIGPVIMRAEKENCELIIREFPRVCQRFSLLQLRELRIDIGSLHPEFAHDFTELRRQTLRHALHTCGYPTDSAERLLEHFLQMRHQIELFPDVTDSLGRLSRNFPIVAVSNGNADVDRLDLGHYFTAKVNARIAGAGKPDPRIFQAACSALGVEPESVLHIGDNPTEDIAGAKNFGMPTAWMNRYRKQWKDSFEPNIVVNSLAELADILL